MNPIFGLIIILLLLRITLAVAPFNEWEILVYGLLFVLWGIIALFTRKT